MSKSINQKIKLLALWDILLHNTDENRALSTDEIIALPKEKNIDVAHKVLHEDNSLLNEFGYEVLSYKKKSYYYYVITRPLETAEAVMLSDAVNATKLPETQKTSLIGRLSETSGAVNKGMFGVSPLKRTNRHILYSIDQHAGGFYREHQSVPPPRVTIRKRDFTICKRGTTTLRSAVSSMRMNMN